MDHSCIRTAILCALVTFIPSAWGATKSPDHTFNFGFKDATVVEIPQCATLAMKAIPLDSSSTDIGKPPYTVFGFEVGGISSKQVVGTDGNNLQWQVQHEIGAKLMISMMDANGKFGGIPNMYYNVTAGQSDSCMPVIPSSIPKLVPNITNADIQTCEPWGMTVSGGTPPYTVTLAALGAPVFTNVNSPNITDYNRFTYVNRADPGTDLIAVISDSTGQYGVSTQPVHTKGPTDVSCRGRGTSWRPADNVAAEQTQLSKNISAQEAAERSKAVVGAVVGVLIGLSAIAALIFFWRKRRNQRFRKVKPSKTNDFGEHKRPLELFPDVEKQASSPYLSPPAPAYVPALPRPAVQDMPARALPQLRSSPIVTPSPAMSLSTSTSISLRPLANPFSDSPLEVEPGTLVVPSALHSPRVVQDTTPSPYTLTSPSNSTSPALPGTRAARKAQEAAEQRRVAAENEAATSIVAGPSRTLSLPAQRTSVGPLSSTLPQRSATASATLPAILDEDTESSTIVIQHRDAGVPPPVVVELPPAYCQFKDEQGREAESSVAAEATGSNRSEKRRQT